MQFKTVVFELARRTVLAVVVVVLVTGLTLAGRSAQANLEPEMTQVDPDTLSCAGVITFDDVPGGSSPGTNYDAVFESGGADFAERFAGQTLSYNGNYDVLSGSPAGPLALQAGAPGQNLAVMFYGSSQVLSGLGPIGFPDYGAIGEGSFAVLFDYDQSEFGFDLIGSGANGGSATVSFYRRDGSLIATITLSGLADGRYGFRRAGGVKDIAGISIHNDDPGGVGFDNLCHDVPGIPGRPVVAPPPLTWLVVRAVIDDNSNGEVDYGEIEVGGVAVAGFTPSGEPLGTIFTRTGETSPADFGGLVAGEDVYYSLHVIGAPDGLKAAPRSEWLVVPLTEAEPTTVYFMLIRE